jgi:hypothetical protein
LGVKFFPAFVLGVRWREDERLRVGLEEVAHDFLRLLAEIDHAIMPVMLSLVAAWLVQPELLVGVEVAATHRGQFTWPHRCQQLQLDHALHLAGEVFIATCFGVVLPSNTSRPFSVTMACPLCLYRR